jgi:ribosome-associated protein
MAKTERKETTADKTRKPRAKAGRRRVGDALDPETTGTGREQVIGARRAALGRSGQEAGGTTPAKRTRDAEVWPSEIGDAVRAALDKKAQDVVVLDLRNTPAFTDFFVLCSGLNPRQVKAIADSVEETLRANKVRPAHTEGYDRAEWVLMDFFTFIVHVFTPQTRAFYGLERLWGDAERVNVDDEASAFQKKA